MCGINEYTAVMVEEGREEAWEMALTISRLTHIERMQLFHEYEMKKILSRYTYDEAVNILNNKK